MAQAQIRRRNALQPLPLWAAAVVGVEHCTKPKCRPTLCGTAAVPCGGLAHALYSHLAVRSVVCSSNRFMLHVAAVACCNDLSHLGVAVASVAHLRHERSEGGPSVNSRWSHVCAKGLTLAAGCGHINISTVACASATRTIAHRTAPIPLESLWCALPRPDDAVVGVERRRRRVVRAVCR